MVAPDPADVDGNRSAAASSWAVVAGSAVEFTGGFSDGEAGRRDADDGGTDGLSGQFGDAALVAVLPQVGEGGRGGHGIACDSVFHAVIWSLRWVPGKRCRRIELKVRGRSPSPRSMASAEPTPGGQGAGGEIVDADDGDVAVGRGYSHAGDGASLDDPVDLAPLAARRLGPLARRPEPSSRITACPGTPGWSAAGISRRGPLARSNPPTGRCRHRAARWPPPAFAWYPGR